MKWEELFDEEAKSIFYYSFVVPVAVDDGKIYYAHPVAESVYFGDPTLITFWEFEGNEEEYPDFLKFMDSFLYHHLLWMEKKEGVKDVLEGRRRFVENAKSVLRPFVEFKKDCEKNLRNPEWISRARSVVQTLKNKIYREKIGERLEPFVYRRKLLGLAFYSTWSPVSLSETKSLLEDLRNTIGVSTEEPGFIYPFIQT